MRTLILSLLLCAAMYQSTAQSKTRDLREIREMVEYLASDQLEGRYPGTRGDTLASEFIVRHFRKAKLKPLFDTYFQPFTFPGKKFIEGPNTLTIGNHTLPLNTDYIPLTFSASTRFSGEIMLGESESTTPQFNGQCALIFVSAQNRSDIEFGQLLYEKTREAQDRGAAAVLFIDTTSDTCRIAPKISRRLALQIPAVLVYRSTAAEIFGQEWITKTMEHPVGTNFESIDPRIEMQVTVQQEQIPTHNIIAWLPGSDPDLQDEYIVIGAHYDHEGYGGFDSGSRRPDTIAIHHGADDNASGVASVLRLVRHCVKHRPARSVIFALFSAEEVGLIGSKYFTEHMPVDRSTISAMFNIDMVGHMRNASLSVGGSGTALESDSLLRAHAKTCGLHVTCSPEGHGPSDHAPFYAKQIPVFFFNTGGTEEYHTPADQAHTLNYPGMDSVIRYISVLVDDVANRDNRLTFCEAGPAKAAPKRVNLKVTLGLMPDVTGSSNNGLRADLVVKGKPADRAGMRTGDVIVEIDGKSVGNIEDYMARLAQLQPDTSIEVKVRRNDEIITLTVEL